LNRSPVATISLALALASAIMSATRFSAVTRLWRPCSPASSPSAICFCRVSTARIIGGQMNFAANQMNRPNPMACISMVRLMFIASSCGLISTVT
jgi:hypothetical protein